VQVAQVACGYWHSHALSRGEGLPLAHLVECSVFCAPCSVLCVLVQGARSSPGGRTGTGSWAWALAARASPLPRCCAPCRASPSPSWRPAALTASRSRSREPPSAGAATTSVSWGSATATVGGPPKVLRVLVLLVLLVLLLVPPLPLSAGPVSLYDRRVAFRSFFSVVAEVPEISESDPHLLWRRSHGRSHQGKLLHVCVRERDSESVEVR